MKCEKAMEAYCGAERGRRVPFMASLHLAACDRCRAECERLDRAENLLLQCAPAEGRDYAAGIMAAVRLLPKPDAAPTKFRQWLAAGAAILAVFVLLPFGNDFLWGKTTFGSSFLLPLYLVLGSVLAIYILLFVLSHVESLSQILKLKRRS